MSPVEELREAAKQLRELAGKATPSADPYPGGWAGFGTDADPHGRSMLFGGPAKDGYRTGTVFSTDEYCDACVGPSDADVQYIASMHPAVALALADWLEDEAIRIDDVPYRVDSDWIERNYRAPLAVARAYLGQGGEHR